MRGLRTVRFTLLQLATCAHGECPRPNLGLRPTSRSLHERHLGSNGYLFFGIAYGGAAGWALLETLARQSGGHSLVTDEDGIEAAYEIHGAGLEGRALLQFSTVSCPGMISATRFHRSGLMSSQPACGFSWIERGLTTCLMAKAALMTLHGIPGGGRIGRLRRHRRTRAP
jgi:hypothetical protein